jgi:hypothetical protein
MAFYLLTVPQLWRNGGACVLKDPESYADGSIAAGKVSQAGQVKGEEPDDKRYVGPPGCVTDLTP